MAKFYNPHAVLQTRNQKQSFIMNTQHDNSLFKLQTLITVKETAVLRENGVGNLSFKATVFC